MNQHEETLKKNEYLQNNQTSGWSRHGQGQRQARHRQEQATPGKVKGKNKNKGRSEHHGKKGKKGFSKWRSTKTSKKHKLVKVTQNGRTQVGITLTTGLTQTGGRATGAQMRGLTLHGNKWHDSCRRRSWLKNSQVQRTEEAFQCEVV